MHRPLGGSPLTKSSTDSQQCFKIYDLELGRTRPHRGHQVLQPDLKQMGAAENRVDPLEVAVFRVQAELEQFRTAPNDRKRPADFMDDARKQTSHLNELPVEHGQGNKLPVLHQPPNPRQH